MVDLSATVGQQAFGSLVGISQQAVSDLARRGVLADGGTAGQWLLDYCDHLREMAAGRGGDGAAKLVTERALLARAQRERLDMQNAVTRRELAPVAVLEQVLAATGSKVSKVLATIPGEIRRRCPQVTSSDLAAVGVIVAKAQNQAAALSLKVLDAPDEDGAGAEPESGDIEAEAA